MKISELKPRIAGVNLEFDVIDKGPVREFNKFGRAGRVCTATVKDDSGQVKLSLWNDEVDKISQGDKVKLTDGYVGEYQGELQLTAGRQGKLEVIGKSAAGDSASQPKPSTATKAASKPGKKGKADDDDDDSGNEDPSYDNIDEEFIE